MLLYDEYRDTPADCDGASMAEVEDRAFFRSEVERLTDRLYGTALRLTRNPADAEDLVSEAIVRAWANFGQLADRQAFPKWLFRILANTFVSDRRRMRHEHANVSLTEEGETFSLFERMHQPFLLWWGNPERELVNRLLRKDIERAFDALPEEFRVVVILIEIDGQSYADVADILGIPIGTVRSRLSRARSTLQRALWEQACAAGLTPSEGGARE
jgi:RNA polymerase sigma-70 factor, ECF subfamily